jgi:uncharacterized Zn-finger protein
MTIFERIEVNTLEVVCDGGGGALGHPRVYLHIDRDHGDQVVCGYCSRTFVYKEPHASSAA